MSEGLGVFVEATCHDYSKDGRVLILSTWYLNITDWSLYMQHTNYYLRWYLTQYLVGGPEHNEKMDRFGSKVFKKKIKVKKI